MFKLVPLTVFEYCKMVAALGGRVRCKDIDTDELSKAITLHVGADDNLARWLPYGQIRSRRLPPWSDLWRQRSALHDFLRASGGYQHKQKDVELQVRKSVDELNLATPANIDRIEAVAYRIRAMMGHARNTKIGMWKVPKKYDQLHGVFILARIEGSPRHKRDRSRSGSPDVEDDDDGEIMPIEVLAKLGDLESPDDSSSESSAVLCTADSSFLSEAELDEVLKNIQKRRKRVSSKSNGEDQFVASTPYVHTEAVGDSIQTKKFVTAPRHQNTLPSSSGRRH